MCTVILSAAKDLAFAAQEFFWLGARSFWAIRALALECAWTRPAGSPQDEVWVDRGGDDCEGIPMHRANLRACSRNTYYGRY